jgi:hypothetical protein
MAAKKTKSGNRERLTGRQRREQREIERRSKRMMKAGRKMGLRERIIGCGFSALIVGGAVFLLAVIGGLVWTYVLHR